MRSSQTVGASIATTDDDDMLACNIDGRSFQVALLHFVSQWQVLHSLVNASQLATRHRKITPCSCAARQDHRVVRCHQDIDVNVLPDDCIGPELGTFCFHLLNAPINVALLHLEFGNAITKQSANAISTLKHGDFMPSTSELLCNC